MGFWNFLRDLIVLDWILGEHDRDSLEQEHQSENQHYTIDLDDDYRRGYHGYNNTDYTQHDFDDDLDSGMFDDF